MGCNPSNNNDDQGAYKDKSILNKSQSVVRENCKKILQPISSHTTTLYGNNLYVLGGRNHIGFYNSHVYQYDPEKETWCQCQTTNPPSNGRQGHSESLLGHKIYILGGLYDEKEFVSDLKEVVCLDMNDFIWESHTCQGDSPGELFGHSAQVYQKKIFIFGGCNKDEYYNDLFALDVDNWFTYKNIQTSGDTPSKRSSHGSSIISNEMYIFGGSNGNQYFNDIWKLNFGKFEWMLVQTGCQYLNKCILKGNTQYENEIIIFGGEYQKQPMNEFVKFNTKTKEWKKIKNSIPKRYNCSLINFIDKIYIIGGAGENNDFDDVVILKYKNLK